MYAMASATANDKTEVPQPQDASVEAGKVVAVRNQLLLQGDEGLAHRLQDEEFGKKYNWNRQDRRTARKDVPLAKVVHTEEEERLQKEYFDRLERDKQRAEMDAKIAKEIEKEERLRNDLRVIETRDTLFAQQLQLDESAELAMRAQQDEQLAMQMQREEIIRKHNERLQREVDDQSLARRLQEREHQLAEMARMERTLQQQHRYRPSGSPREVELVNASRGNALHRNLLIPVDVTDRPEFSEAEPGLYFDDDVQLARELHQLQLEQLRAGGDQAYDIERSDARLARILQEQERLDAMRRAEERRIRRLHHQLSMQQQLQQQPPRMIERSQSARVQPPQPPSYSRYPMSSRGYTVDDGMPETYDYNRGYFVDQTPLPRGAGDRVLYGNSSRHDGVGMTSPLHPRPAPQQIPDDFLRYPEPVRRSDYPPDSPGNIGAGEPVYSQPVRVDGNPGANVRAGTDRQASYSQAAAENNVQLPRKKGKGSESNSNCKQQ